MPLSEGKKKSNLKWDKANKERMKYLRYRSYSKSFIGIADIGDLLRMNEIILENKDMSKCIMFTSRDDCFKLLKKHLKERCGVEKKVKKVFKHSKRVLDICEEIISYLNLKKHLRRMTYRLQFSMILLNLMGQRYLTMKMQKQF